VLSGRGLCDELITRPEESYRLCWVVVCGLETSRLGAPYIYIYIYIYIYDISSLRVNHLPFLCILPAHHNGWSDRSVRLTSHPACRKCDDLLLHTIQTDGIVHRHSGKTISFLCYITTISWDSFLIVWPWSVTIQTSKHALMESLYTG